MCLSRGVKQARQIPDASPGYSTLLRALFARLWLVLIATFATYSVYYTSLRMFPVAKVSAAIYLSPPVTMLWAWMLFSEPLPSRCRWPLRHVGRRLAYIEKLIGVYRIICTGQDALHWAEEDLGNLHVALNALVRLFRL